MKVLAQTKLTPVVTIYDSSAPKSKAGEYAKKFLQPVISVQDDDGTVIYSTGQFYESYFPVILGFVGLVVLGFVIRRAL